MDRCRLGYDFSEVIPQAFLNRPVPTYIPYIICHVGSGFSQHTLSSQSPYSIWLYGKLMSKVVYYLFVPGWPSTSAIHTSVHRHDPGVTTQHNPSKSHFHPGSSLNLVVFHNSLTKSFHSIAEQQLNLMAIKESSRGC